MVCNESQINQTSQPNRWNKARMAYFQTSTVAPYGLPFDGNLFSYATYHRLCDVKESVLSYWFHVATLVLFSSYHRGNLSQKIQN
jgi:hypothetical protein